jgi:hypothetical protein
MVPSISTRVTEFTDHKLRNDLRARNLHVIMDDMFLLSRYTKMTNLTGMDICVPAFFPQPLQDMFLETLGGGLRDCMALLASVLYGEEAMSLYTT